MPATLIHNQLAPYHIDLGGDVRLTHWEHATRQLPQQDLAELLAYTLTPQASRKEVDHYLEAIARLFFFFIKFGLS